MGDEIVKSRILILCGIRTFVLASKLKAELAEVSTVSLWCDDGRGETSVELLQMLEDATEQFDFAAIILAKDDVTDMQDGRQIVHDTFAFHAGLILASIGRKRCFLLHSVVPSNMPTNLGGIVTIPFTEPADLTQPGACANAIAGIVKQLKSTIYEQGTSPYRVLVPILSVGQLFRRERHHSEGGDLQLGEVIVCDTQPMVQEEMAIQISHNFDHGIRYTYFLYFTVDTIEKICQALQIILVAGVAGAEQAAHFTARMSIIAEEKNRILDHLQDICRGKKLRIILLSQEPQFSFRIHNANSRELATVYARYGERSFILWSQGPSAEALWRDLPKYIEEEGKQPDCLFGSLRVLPLDADKNRLFQNSLDRGLSRYFPGLEREVRELCTGTPS